MSIYGDMLAFFPEMFQTVSWFKKEPKVGAGYKPVSDGMVDVIIMPEKRFTALVGKNTNSPSNNVLNYSDKEYIWVSEDSPLEIGTFIIDDRNRMCTITGKAEWGYYGGFICFDFEIMQGTQGDRPTATPITGRF